MSLRMTGAKALAVIATATVVSKTPEDPISVLDAETSITGFQMLPSAS